VVDHLGVLALRPIGASTTYFSAAGVNAVPAAPLFLPAPELPASTLCRAKFHESGRR
jgi:hypothetical protein